MVVMVSSLFRPIPFDEWVTLVSSAMLLLGYLVDEKRGEDMELGPCFNEELWWG